MKDTKKCTESERDERANDRLRARNGKKWEKALMRKVCYWKWNERSSKSEKKHWMKWTVTMAKTKLSIVDV